MKEILIDIVAHVIALAIAIFITLELASLFGRSLWYFVGILIGTVIACFIANLIVQKITGKPQKKYHIFKK